MAAGPPTPLLISQRPRAEMSEPGEREFQIVLTYFFKPAAGNLASQALTGSSSPPQALDDARGNADAQFAVFVCITRDALRIDAEDRSQQGVVEAPARGGKEHLTGHPATLATCRDLGTDRQWRIFSPTARATGGGEGVSHLTV